MRVIKFRAWYRGRMYHVIEHMTYADGSSDVTMLMDADGYSFSPGGNVEVMQFTGLKDKNGREIYEGDIVVWPLMSNNFGPPQVVEWDENILGYQPYCDYDRDCDGYPRYNEQQQWTLIGNIYENPDLLHKQS